MKMSIGPWREVTIAQNGTSSSEVDLGDEYAHVQVYNPAIDSATITIKPSRKTGDTAVSAYAWKGTEAADFAMATTARTAAGMNVFKDICAEFVTVVLGASQTSAARTFYIRGVSY